MRLGETEIVRGQDVCLIWVRRHLLIPQQDPGQDDVVNEFSKLKRCLECEKAKVAAEIVVLSLM